MRPLILHIIVLFLPIFLLAQTDFQVNLPVSLDSAVLVCVPDGSGAYVSGKVTGGSKFHVLKLDGAGNLAWDQTYDGNPKLVNMSVANDGLLLAFNLNVANNRSKAYLQKLDNNGQPVWGRRLGRPSLTNIASMTSDPDGNAWVSGVNLPQNQNDSAYYFLMKIGPDGQLLDGRKTRHFYFLGTPDEIYQLKQLNWNAASNSLLGIEDFDGAYGDSGISQPSRGKFSLGFTSPDLNVYVDYFWTANFHHINALAHGVSCSGLNFGNYNGVNHPDDGSPCNILLTADGREARAIILTENVHLPIRSYTDDILYYDFAKHSLIRYDTLLMPVWAGKLDNCTETSGFSGEVASDGSLFSVRQIGTKTVVSRFIPGQEPECMGYLSPLPFPDVPILPFRANYGAGGRRNFPLMDADSVMNPAVVIGQTMDFCLRLDAEFEIPDTICLGESIMPTNFDTTAGLIHSWNFPGGVSFDSMPTLLLDGLGSNIVRHGIKFSGCTSMSSEDITILGLPNIPLMDTVVCGPSSLDIDLGQPWADQFTLNGTPIEPAISISQSGTYVFKASNSLCETEKEVTIRLTSFTPPLADVEPYACEGVPFVVDFDNTFNSVTWDGQPASDSFIINDGLIHLYHAIYALDTACLVEGMLQVARHECDVVYMPNAFSPNGDGINDIFEAQPTADSEIEGLQVFDRWGELVFDSKPNLMGWDGQFKGKQPEQGVYTFVVRYFDKRHNQHTLKMGDMVLLL